MPSQNELSLLVGKTVASVADDGWLGHVQISFTDGTTLDLVPKERRDPDGFDSIEWKLSLGEPATPFTHECGNAINGFPCGCDTMPGRG